MHPDPPTNRCEERPMSFIDLLTDEAAEGRDAFLEKRPPKWTGR